VFLDRDDTNDRDELTLRGRVAADLGAWHVDASAMLVDLDNGYDVFTIDNSFTTRSDRPARMRSGPSAARSLRPVRSTAAVS
jgi:hypothetical protein